MNTLLLLAALTVSLGRAGDGVSLDVTLEDAKGRTDWRLYAIPKLYSRFHEVRPDSAFEWPFGSGTTHAPSEVKGLRQNGCSVNWRFPVREELDWTTTYVFTAIAADGSSESAEASVARLACRNGDESVLNRARCAYWAQGTESIACDERYRVGDERVYRMKRTGTEVFEVNLPAVSPLARPVSILAWGDNHFKLADEKDLANDNIAEAFRRRGSANPPDKIAASAQREVEMSPYFDQTVVLGDNIDFFSTGSLELWRKMVLDPLDRNLLAVVGAHDVRTDFINGRPYMEMPPEKTLPTVSKYIPNDVYYASKLVGEKVLCVCIWSDWGWFVDYWNVAEKLRKDLDQARQNGWTVVLFGHDGFYPNTWTKDADGQYDYEADKAACLMHGFCQSGDNAKKRESYANRGDYLTGHRKRDEHISRGTKAFYDVLYASADVVAGIFQGHVHANYCMRIRARTPDGRDKAIPQYSCRGSAFCPDGFVFKINIK